MKTRWLLDYLSIYDVVEVIAHMTDTRNSDIGCLRESPGALYGASTIAGLVPFP